MAKFKAGDKVRVVTHSESVPYGTELTVKRGPIGDLCGGNYSFVESGAVILGDDLKKVKQKQTKSQRIEALEKQVAEQAEALASLQAEVEALKKAQQPDVTTIADALAKRVEARVITPNQKRKAIIDEAKAFVESAQRKQRDASCTTEGNEILRVFVTKTEFVVNNKKRTVVALIRYLHGDDSTVIAKGIAKCAPDDVFNADIGKAIALGRALGLDVSKFEQAVKPTDVVVGQIFKVTEKGDVTGAVAKITHMLPSFDGIYGKAFGHTGDSGWLGEKQVAIIDDTEAQYE